MRRRSQAPEQFLVRSIHQRVSAKQAVEKKPQAMNIKGKTKAKVQTIAQIEHLDPTSQRHKTDQQKSKEMRQYVSRLDELVTTIPTATKLPSLGSGLMLTPDGKELTSDQHKKTLSDSLSERRYYTTEHIRSDGRKYNRTRQTDPIHQIAVTYRPQHVLALMRLESDGDFRSRPFVKETSLKITKAFQAATGYDPIAIDIHPKEGCLHFHIIYSSVSAEGKLIHARYQRGRHGSRHLGPALIGALRLGEEGLLAPDLSKGAKYLLESRREKLGGQDPIDFRMSQLLDGLCEKFADGHGPTVRDAFDQAREDYRESFSKGELLPRRRLLERVEDLEKRLVERDAEIMSLLKKHAPARSGTDSAPSYKSYSPKRTNITSPRADLDI